MEINEIKEVEKNYEDVEKTFASFSEEEIESDDIDLQEIDVSESEEQEIYTSMLTICENNKATTTVTQAYLNNISTHPLLSTAEVNELIKRVHEGDEVAKNILTECNLRLAFAIAKRFKVHGVELMDLVQEANMGLIKAIEKFDPKMGYKFSTYATYWCKASVTRYLEDNGRTVRIPVGMQEKIRKIKKITNQLETDGEKVCDKYIAEQTNLTIEQVNLVKEAMTASTTSSLNEIVDLEGKTELEELIPDYSADGATNFNQKETRRMLIELVQSVSKNPREADVIFRAFGFKGKKNTLEEIGRDYQITKERVRQIRNAGLERIAEVMSNDSRNPKMREVLLTLRDETFRNK